LPADYVAKGCALKDIPGPPRGGGEPSVSDCGDLFSREESITSVAAVGYTSMVQLSPNNMLICYSLSTSGKCHGLMYADDSLGNHLRNHLTRTASAVNLNAGPVSHLAMSKIDNIRALVCYADGSSGNRGVCKVVQMTIAGSLLVLPPTTGYFTSVGVAAAQITTASFSETILMACWSQPLSNKGKCQSMTYAGDNAALSFSAAGLYQFADVGPPTVALGSYSPTHAMLCWMDSDVGKCKVLKMSGAQVTAPGASVPISQSAVTFAAVGTFTSTEGLVCFNEAGAVGKCRYLSILDTVVTMAGASVIIETKPTSYMSIANNGYGMASICYQARGRVRCSILKRDTGSSTTSTKMVGNFKSEIYSAGEATYVVTRAFTNETSALCFKKGTNGYIACVTYSTIAKSGDVCDHDLEGYTCDPYGCLVGPGVTQWIKPTSPRCLRSCDIATIGEAPRIDATVSTATATQQAGILCHNQIGPQCPLLKVPAVDSQATVLLTRTTSILCFPLGSKAKCVPGYINEQNVSSATPVILSQTETTNIAAAKLDGSTAVVCYSAKAFANRGACKVAELDNGNVNVADGTQAYFTGLNVPATLTKMDGFTNTRAIICYTVVQGTSVKKGICQLIVYTSTFVQISYPATGKYEFSPSNAPTTLNVQTISASQAIVCWMKTSTGKCQVLLLSGNTITGPGTVLTISNGYPLSYLDIAQFPGTTISLVCYNIGGSSASCLALKYDGGNTLSILGQPLAVDSVSADYITVATTSATQATVCYSRLAENLRCGSLSLNTADNNNPLTSYSNADIDAAGAAKYNIAETISSDQVLVCYQIGSNSYPACTVVNTKLASGKTCEYYADGFTCTPATCDQGTWKGKPTCTRSCPLTLMPPSPRADFTSTGSVALTVCENQVGAERPISAMSIQNTARVAMAVLSEKEAVVCYTTQGYSMSSACFGLHKMPGKTDLLRSKLPTILTQGAAGYLEIEALDTTTVMACFADGSNANAGKCVAMAYNGAGQQVELIPAAEGSFSDVGTVISIPDIAPLAKITMEKQDGEGTFLDGSTKVEGIVSVICYGVVGATAGKCKLAWYQGRNNPISYGDVNAEYTFTNVMTPSALEVTALSKNKALVCWIDPTGVWCKVLLTDQVQTLSAPGPSLHVDEKPKDWLTVAACNDADSDADRALLCFQQDTGMTECLSLLFDGTYTLAAGVPRVVETNVASHLSVTSSGTDNGLMCYQTQGQGLRVGMTAMTCGAMTLKAGQITPRVQNVDIVAAGPSKFVSVKYFDKTAALLCYGKEATDEDGTESRTASCVVVLNAVTTGSSCAFTLLGYTCPRQYCSNGFWDNQVICMNLALANASAEVFLGAPLMLWVTLVMVGVMTTLFVTYSLYDEKVGYNDLDHVQDRVNTIELDWEERHGSPDGGKAFSGSQATAAGGATVSI